MLSFAAVCTDGVVIIEDTALTRMDTFELIRHDEKLRGVIRNVIFGYSGSENMYDIFVKYVVGELVMLRDDVQHYNSVNMISKFSRIMNLLRGINSSFNLKILIARQFPGNWNSDVFILQENGVADSISTWRSIGNADLAAEPLVREFWSKKKTVRMRDFAKLCHCIIKFIENEELAVGVGVGSNNPSIRYLKHGAEIDGSPQSDEFDSFNDCYESNSQNFKIVLGSLYSELKQSTKNLRQHIGST